MYEFEGKKVGTFQLNCFIHTSTHVKMYMYIKKNDHVYIRKIIFKEMNVN